MGPLDASRLAEGALVLLDSAPVIYFLQDDATYAPRFLPLFERQKVGAIEFAITTITIAEVLTGPFKAGEEALARRYRAVMESWQVVPLTAEIAEGAARFRASSGLRTADAIQVASAIAVNADALVTHDRDFSRVKSLKILQ